jgi:hypothetical protein
MSSVAHEVVVQVLREEGVLAEVLRRARGIEVGAVAPADPNLSEVKSTEWHGDALFTKGDPKSPERWLMLEAQLSVDPEKLRTIPLGLELARDRFRGADGDAVLVTVGEKVARWFDRHPFIYRGPLGTRRSLAVIRVDLARLPIGKLLDEERPSLALLAAAAHARGPRAKARRIAERALRVARKGGGPLAPGLVDVSYPSSRRCEAAARAGGSHGATGLSNRLAAGRLCKRQGRWRGRGRSEGRSESSPARAGSSSFQEGDRAHRPAAGAH